MIGKRCQHCDTTDQLVESASRYNTCSGCLDVQYCSDQCQRADWPIHKQACNNIRDDRVASKLMCDDAALKHYSKWRKARFDVVKEITGQLLVGKLDTHVVKIVLKYQPKKLPPFFVQSIEIIENSALRQGMYLLRGIPASMQESRRLLTREGETMGFALIECAETFMCYTAQSAFTAEFQLNNSAYRRNITIAQYIDLLNTI